MISTLFLSLNTNNISNDEERQFVQRLQRDPSGAPPLQPILIVLQRTMPVWKEICNLWMNDMQVLEVSSFPFIAVFIFEKAFVKLLKINFCSKHLSLNFLKQIFN